MVDMVYYLPAGSLQCLEVVQNKPQCIIHIMQPLDNNILFTLLQQIINILRALIAPHMQSIGFRMNAAFHLNASGSILERAASHV